MPKPKVVSVVGNRPQLVKAAPLHAALGRSFDLVAVDTDQHYDHELNALLYEELGIAPARHRLGVGSGSHAAMTARILERIGPVLEAEQPAATIVYGDTNTTLAGALAAAKLTIPVVHVEAGLRSYDRSMPEEVNRVVVDHLARLLLCPTEVARQNLAAEGVRDGVELTGDVMADAARLFGPLADRRGGVVAELGVARGGFLLATVHRDANTRPPALGRIVAGLSSLEEPVLLPLHPRTAAALRREGLAFGGSVRTLPPLGYLDFTALLRAARVLLTDSGGAQKEAYLHGVPCVTLRDRTEWTETVTAGWNRLVGDDPEQLRTAVAEARAGVGRPDLYGDGHAADRSVRLIERLVDVPRAGEE